MVHRVFHCDSIADLERTPAGGVVFPAVLTKPGVVEYLRPDGSVRREWRSPADVFDPESLATLEGVPVTREHPGLITTDNFRDHTRGHVVNGSVTLDAPRWARGQVTVNDSELIDDIDNNVRRQLSPGYTCTVVDEPGVTPEGEPFDARQTRIKYNHIAVTKRGRQGPDVALRLDSTGELLYSEPGSIKEKPAMDEIELFGVRINVTGMSAEAVQKLRSLVTENAARMDSAAGRAAGEAERLRSELLRSETARAAAEKRLAEASRFDADDVELLATAASVLGADYDATGKTPADIMRDIVAKEYPSLDLSEKSEEFIAGLYAAVAEELGEETQDSETETETPAADNPPARMDSTSERVNLATSIAGRENAAPRLHPAAELRADYIARGRKPLRALDAGDE